MSLDACCLSLPSCLHHMCFNFPPTPLPRETKHGALLTKTAKSRRTTNIFNFTPLWLQFGPTGRSQRPPICDPCALPWSSFWADMLLGPGLLAERPSCSLQVSSIRNKLRVSHKRKTHKTHHFGKEERKLAALAVAHAHTLPNQSLHCS